MQPYEPPTVLDIEVSLEKDGRYQAEAKGPDGCVLAYGDSEEIAIANAYQRYEEITHG